MNSQARFKSLLKSVNFIRKLLNEAGQKAFIPVLFSLIAACGEQNSQSTPSAQQPIPSTLHPSTIIHPERWPKQSSPIVRDPVIEQRIQNLLKRMTLEEKVGQVIQADIGSITVEEVKQYNLGSILNGGNSAPNNDNRIAASEWLKLADQFWEASTDTSDGGVGIPVMWGTDAVHGNSNVVGATIFPHNIGLGAARDPKLLHKIGRITATEMLITGFDWTFAPTVAVARNDRWGRTYESYSENPEIQVAYVPELLNGIQGRVNSPEYLDGLHILATVKHYLGDGGTVNGVDQGNNLSSEEELRDIHGAPYPVAIQHGALSVMASFNAWHGQRMHGHKPLLTDVLVKQMGFDGFVVGDWNGHALIEGCTPENCPQSLMAGVDMYMAPDSWKGLYHNLLDQIKDNRIPMSRLDEAVTRILRTKIRMGLLDKPKPSDRPLAGEFDKLGSPKHTEVAREAVRKSLVLLKNNDQLLPLQPNQHILITGDAADNIGKQCGGWTLTWQGTGNSNDNFPHGISIGKGLQAALEQIGSTVEISTDGSFQNKPDVAVVIYGEEPYAEFMGDRPNVDFNDDRGLKLLTKLKQQKIKTVSVFLSGRPLWVNPELNQSDAFVAAWLPGTAGNGVADVLVADNQGNPVYDFQGRLSFSWPNKATDAELNFGEDNYEPLFPYGFGLSYANFDPTKHNLKRLSEESGLNHVNIDNSTKFMIKGHAVLPFQLELIDRGKSTLVENPTQVSNLRAITTSTADRDQQEDTLIIDWNEKGIVAISKLNGGTIDLSREMIGDMALELEYRVLAYHGTPARLGMACGTHCGGYIDISQSLLEQVNQGWQTKQIALRCLKNAGLRIDKISSPFVIASDGKLKLQLAKVEVVPNEGKASCEL
jgi:beta-glucosidase